MSTVVQHILEHCNNCDDRFWSFQEPPIWCLKCELLGLPLSVTMTIETPERRG